MKNTVVLLTTILFATVGARPDEGFAIQYRDLTGRVSMEMSHDIELRGDHPIEARRGFDFDLALAVDDDGTGVTVTIDRAKATNAAHGTEQRLGTRHVSGRAFEMRIADDGRRLESADPPDAALIDLGPMVPQGFSVTGALAGVLPVLPAEPVAVGTTWTSEDAIRSLEGWAWTGGRLVSRHRVESADRVGSHVVLTIATEGQANLEPLEGQRAFKGELQRETHWTFDATTGRILSLSLVQQTDGVSDLGNGQTPIRQRTKVELKSSGSATAP